MGPCFRVCTTAHGQSEWTCRLLPLKCRASWSPPLSRNMRSNSRRTSPTAWTFRCPTAASTCSFPARALSTSNSLRDSSPRSIACCGWGGSLSSPRQIVMRSATRSRRRSPVPARSISGCSIRRNLSMQCRNFSTSRKSTGSMAASGVTKKTGKSRTASRHASGVDSSRMNPARQQVSSSVRPDGQM